MFLYSVGEHVYNYDSRQLNQLLL